MRCGNVTGTGYNTSSESETFTLSGTIKYYKVTDLIIYKISEVRISDVKDNIGGKLFKDEEDTITLKTSDMYDGRFTGIEGKTPSIEINVGNTDVYSR